MRCIITFTYQLCCRIYHYKGQRKKNMFGIEWQKTADCLCYDINVLGENLQTVRENTEMFIKARKEFGQKVNSEKLNIGSCLAKRIIVLNQNIIIEYLFFENVEKFKYLKIMVTNTNDIHEELKCTINMGRPNAHYFSLEKVLLSCYFPKNSKLIHIKQILLIVGYRMVLKTCLSLLESG